LMGPSILLCIFLSYEFNSLYFLVSMFRCHTLIPDT
jgi:hypothetical protein